MKKLMDFDFSKIEKVNLNSVKGGATGYETDTYSCTEKDFGFGQGAGDTCHDGDWQSTC